MLKKIALTLSILLLVLVAAVLFFANRVGAWNVIFPSSHHETVAPEIPTSIMQPAVLVFSKTNSFRHKEGIEGGLKFFENLANKRDWGIFSTENSAVFDENILSRFSAIVFNNVTGDVLSDQQEAEFQRWLEAGGSWVGIHSAGDGSHLGWEWYVDNLIGARFTAHTMGPQFQTATARVEDTDHPATQSLSSSWQHEEEWYSWDRSPRDAGFNVLVSVDENTYQPRFIFLGMDRDLHMGDHPVVWNRCVGQGRALYSALGHQAKAFESPEYQAILEGALEWAMTRSHCSR